MDVYFNGAFVETIDPDDNITIRDYIWLFARRDTFDTIEGMKIGEVFFKTSSHDTAIEPSIADIHNYLTTHYMPEFAPTSVDGLVAWHDADDGDTITVSGGSMSQWDDKSGNDNHLVQSTASKQPAYESSNAVANDRPAIVWPDGGNSNVMNYDSNVSAFTVYTVMAYRDGTQGIFESFASQWFGGTQDDFGRFRLQGFFNQPSIFTSNEFADAVSINGAAASATVLPMPLSVVRADSKEGVLSDMHDVGGVERTTNRGWRGPICEVFIFDRTVSDDDDAKIRLYLSEKWGIS